MRLQKNIYLLSALAVASTPLPPLHSATLTPPRPDPVPSSGEERLGYAHIQIDMNAHVHIHTEINAHIHTFTFKVHKSLYRRLVPFDTSPCLTFMLCGAVAMTTTSTHVHTHPHAPTHLSHPQTRVAHA